LGRYNLHRSNRGILSLCTVFVSLFCYSQQPLILVYDLKNKTIDSIQSAALDTSLQSASTPFYRGSFGQKNVLLKTKIPETNVFPSTSFTLKSIVSKDYPLTNFPIRTTVKIFQLIKDTLQHLCTGSIVSSKHVLTAAHCISIRNTNDLRTFDSLLVAPVYNEGKFNENFPNSSIAKIYFFKDWRIGADDIALLEMEKPVGLSTGWISIGFAPDPELMEPNIFYKFSYPSISNFFLDPRFYNGDTLFYNHGIVDKFTETTLGINATHGLQGESGSSLIKVGSGNTFTSYGVLSLALDLTHSRITREKYWALREVLKNHFAYELEDLSGAYVFPNPASNSFTNRWY
jgi:hypothetical protein